MASSKKPSIYSDRSSIGSVEELDEYGVWVKSEPQVLSAEGADTSKSGNFDEPALSPVEFAGEEVSDDSLSLDEAVLDVNDAVLDVKEPAEESSSVGSSGEESSSAFTDMEFPDDNIEIDSDPLSTGGDLDDLNITDTDLGVPQEESSGNDSSQSDGFEIEDTSFDDFEAPAEDAEGETEISIEDSTIEDSALENNGDIAIKDDFELDDFAVSPDFGGAESGVQDSGNTGDFEAEDFSVPTVKAIENNIESIQEDFDTVVKADESDLSTHLLKKIASELSSIRGELSELKKEFSSVRTVSPAEDGKHEQSGFFSEEDDETISLTGDELDNILSTSEDAAKTETAAEGEEDEAIALTGDELDNILNSADFTEESGTNETVESDFSLDDEPVNVTDDKIELPQEATEEASSENDIASVDLGDDISLDDTALTDDLSLTDDVALTDDLSLSDDAALPDDLSLTDDAALPDDLSLSDDIVLTDDVVLSDDFSLSDDVALTDDAVSQDSLSLGESEVSEDSSPEETTETAGDDLKDIDIDTEDVDIDLGTSALLSEGGALSADTDDSAAEETFDIGTETSEAASDVPGDDLDTSFSDIELSDDVLSDTETNDSPELEKLRSEGAIPITPAPENSSYLEEDENLQSDSFDLSDAVIDEPVLSADDISDDLAEPSLTGSDFDLDSLSDLTIDNSQLSQDIPEEEPASSEESASSEEFASLEEPALSQDALDDIDIDIPGEDDSLVQEQSEKEDEEISFDTVDTGDTGASGTEETVIPEGFEAGIEESPVPFDDDLDEDIAADDFSGALDIPGTDTEDTAAGAEPEAEPEAFALTSVQAGIEEEEKASLPAAQTAIRAESPQAPGTGKDDLEIPSALKSELRNILGYMDRLLESLPEEKIEEFAKSEYFDSYKKLFTELGLI